MLPEERQHNIVELVNRGGIVTVNDIVKSTHASVATVRRDINILSRQNRLVKIHGGAMSNDKSLSPSAEPSIDAKSLLNADEKKAIAVEAMKHIAPGDRVMLDSGTTTYEIAKLLSGTSDLTIVTNDLRIATEISLNQGNDLVFIGGNIRKGYHSSYGYFAEAMLKNISVDKIFLSVDAIDPELGVMSYTMDDVAIKELGIRNAGQTYLLCDHAKFENHALFSIGLLDLITTIITTPKISPATARAFEKAGKKLIIAEM